MAVASRWFTPVLLAALLAPGCRVHDVKLDPTPPVEIPAAWRDAGGAVAVTDRWWTSFGDAALDDAIARALDGSFTLQAAWARLAQAHAVGRQVSGPRLPEVSATVSAARQKSRFDLGAPIGEITPVTNSFTASVGAAYEVDLWKRVDSGVNAVARDIRALRDDIETIALSLAGQIADVWLDVRLLKAQRATLTGQLELNQKSLELLELRFREGLGSALDVYQQRSLVSATRAELINVEAQVVIQVGTLAVLLGTSTGEAQAVVDRAPEALPELPPVPALGVPADLLERRPDVRAARRRVEAADYRVAVAVADRLPALRLQGALSEQSGSIVDLIATPLYSLLASVTAPLFDHGRRRAEVDRNRAVVEERLADYGQAMLRAMVEVETALQQEPHHVALAAELAVQVQLAAATVVEARTAYREGALDNYLPVLTAIQGEQRLALQILGTRRQHLRARVTLYRALGGTWMSTLQAPSKKGSR